MICIRDFHSTDLTFLTELLHRAYQPLADAGLNFLAATQSTAVTAERIADGHCFVLENAGVLAGAICVYPPDLRSAIPEYRKNGTYHIGQFAVDPRFSGQGLGRQLHDHSIAYASRQGGLRMALDTASPATSLIEMYTRWGYREVSRHRWPNAAYDSLIMCLPLPPGPFPARLRCWFNHRKALANLKLGRLRRRFTN